MSYKNLIWVVGRSGRLGAALEYILTSREEIVVATDADEVDITNIEEVEDFIETNQPDVIINCAAKSDRQWCEENPEEAYKLHALGARNLAIGANHIGARLFSLSSDYVFDGKAKYPYTEFDRENPSTIYGKSKLAGEKFIRSQCNRHTIVRSSWLYGKKYLNEIIDQAKTGSISADVDIVGTPTSSLELAEAIIDLLHTNEYGTFHISSEGQATQKEFIEEILRIADIDAHIETGQSTRKFEALRPNYSVLDNMMLRMIGAKPMKDWQQGLERFMRERGVV